VNAFNNNNASGRLLQTWTDFSQPIDRRTYLTHGLALAAVKYAGDAGIVYAATRTIWTPAHYVMGLPALWMQWASPGAAVPGWCGVALIVWMLPFVALGVTLSMRRALDANRSPWLSVLFFVPYINYLLIGLLALAATEAPAADEAVIVRPISPSRVAAGVRAGAIGIAIAVAATTVVSTGIPRGSTYGVWLFLLSPFLTGTCTAFVYNRVRDVSGSETVAVVLATVLSAGVFLLIVPLEGAICLLMMFPLAILQALLGAAVGRGIARAHVRRPRSAALMLVVVPLTALVEPPTGRVLHEVQSSIVIDAPADVVWPHVVAFRDIPEPADWIFRAGVAYPIRARIEGTGVGAVRYCVFSTGAFVEPITHWEPGRRLAFDVVESPAPMRELSPYRDLSPPHLHGYLRSKRGEFRLIDLGNGRTRLEGSTWYEIEMAPEAYWQIISDALIHRIHLRVLEHIKEEVQGQETGDR
jgi:hypothetical protein